MNINGKYPSHSRSADDVVPMSECINKLEEIMNDLNTEKEKSLDCRKNKDTGKKRK